MVPERKARGATSGATSVAARGRTNRGTWDDEEDDAAGAAFKPLTREQALALRRAQPTISPWGVVAAQGGLGGVVALLVMVATGEVNLAGSALYGAATAAVPGALAARTMKMGHFCCPSPQRETKYPRRKFEWPTH